MELTIPSVFIPTDIDNIGPQGNLFQVPSCHLSSPCDDDGVTRYPSFNSGNSFEPLSFKSSAFWCSSLIFSATPVTSCGHGKHVCVQQNIKCCARLLPMPSAGVLHQSRIAFQTSCPLLLTLFIQCFRGYFDGWFHLAIWLAMKQWDCSVFKNVNHLQSW